MSDSYEFLKTSISKAGLFYEPGQLKPEFEIKKGSKSFIVDNEYDLRFKSYEHRWNCGPFSCASWYNVTAFVISKATGATVRLRAVETAMAIQAAPPIDYDPSKGLYYRHYDACNDFYIGCGQKDGHDPDYWGVARCYFETGEIISWRWTSHA